MHIALDEKSFLFGVCKDQGNDVNKLVLMDTKYIHYSRCSKNNMHLTVLKYRLKLLYQTHKQASILERKYDAFQKQYGKNSMTYLDKPQTLNISVKYSADSGWFQALIPYRVSSYSIPFVSFFCSYIIPSQ